MNVLPIVFALLLFMSLSSALLFHSTRQVKVENEAVTGYYRSIAEMENREQVSSFKSAIASEMSKKEKREPSKLKERKGVYVNRREEMTLVDNELSKLNIAWLFRDEVDSERKSLRAAFEKIIIKLYGSASFYKKGIETEIVDRLIDYKDIKSIKDLARYDDDLDGIIRKMIVGTRNYSLEKKRGYPPLSHFVCVDSEEFKKAIYFAYASGPVLSAYFGDGVCEKVYVLEAQKWEENPRTRILKRDEMEKILLLCGESKQEILSHMSNSVSFAKKKIVRKSRTGFDAKTGIYVTGSSD